MHAARPSVCRGCFQQSVNVRVSTQLLCTPGGEKTNFMAGRLSVASLARRTSYIFITVRPLSVRRCLRTDSKSAGGGRGKGKGVVRLLFLMPPQDDRCNIFRAYCSGQNQPPPHFIHMQSSDNCRAGLR